MSQQISIVIPVLNEAANIVRLLEHLISHSSARNIKDLIVVDGGSSDTTVDVLQQCRVDQELDFLKIILSERGRARQLNAGAQQATGNILYFLHADSFPPNDFDTLIINEVNNGHQAGCFRLQFDSSHWWLRLASWMTQFSWRACRGGDQSQFITRDLFAEIGGYDENYLIYEDNILINELYKRNQFTVINKKLTTSARRYETHGVWKLQYHFLVIYIKKWLGASADELQNYYKKTIN